jgi:hypothetical protein
MNERVRDVIAYTERYFERAALVGAPPAAAASPRFQQSIAASLKTEPAVTALCPIIPDTGRSAVTLGKSGNVW